MKTENQIYKRGDKFKTAYRWLNVMTVIDGYVVARYSGCAPFIKSIKEFEIFLIDVKID